MFVEVGRHVPPRVAVTAFVLIALLVEACGGATSASSTPTAAATASTAAVTPSATQATPSPSPSAPSTVVDPTKVLHIVAFLDSLAAMPRDGDVIGQAINTEGTWIHEHIDASMAAGDLAQYVGYFLATLSDVADGSDMTADLQALLAQRDVVAALVPGGILTPPPAANKVGDRIGFTSGGSSGNTFFLTIKAVTGFTQQYNDPAPGTKWIVADVLLEGSSGSSTVQALNFSITDSDGYVYELQGMYKEPSLPYDNTLGAGKKVRGWLTFQVPKAMKAGSIVFADSLIHFTVK